MQGTRTKTRIGESIVYQLPKSRPRAAVLFLHGLSGSPKHTWGRIPHLLMASRFGWEKDFILYAYRSSRWKPGGPTIEGLIEDLTSYISLHMGGYSRVYCIAHSLGSVLALGAGAELERQGVSIAHRLRGLVMIGPALWGSHWGHISPNRTVQNLLPGSASLKKVRDMWVDYAERTGAKSSVLFGSDDRVVERRSSDFQKLGIETKSIARSHVKLTHVQDLDDDVLMALLEILHGFDGVSPSDARLGVVRTVVDSEPEDWIYDDVDGEFVYLPDFDLRILEDPQTEGSSVFSEPWTGKFRSAAQRGNFRILYREACVGKFTMVYCDDGRYIIPLPKSSTELRISGNQYRLARIFNIHCAMNHDLDRGLREGGIEVMDGGDEELRSFL